MLSMPPATTISAEPARKRSVATIAAFIPEPHILLIVVQPAPSGRPAPSEAWRAGACPCPAGKTQPIRISSTLSAATPARSTAADIARAPSTGAETSLKSPRKPPIGVRAAPTMTMASAAFMAFISSRLAAGLSRAGGPCVNSILDEPLERRSRALRASDRAARSRRTGTEQAEGRARPCGRRRWAWFACSALSRGRRRRDAGDRRRRRRSALEPASTGHPRNGRRRTTEDRERRRGHPAHQSACRGRTDRPAARRRERARTRRPFRRRARRLRQFRDPLRALRRLLLRAPPARLRGARRIRRDADDPETLRDGSRRPAEPDLPLPLSRFPRAGDDPDLRGGRGPRSAWRRARLADGAGGDPRDCGRVWRRRRRPRRPTPDD